MASSADRPRTMIDRLRAEGLGDELLSAVDAKVKRRRAKSRLVRRGAIAAAVVLVGALWAVPFLRDRSTLETPAAERRSLALADGSRLELNAQTEVRADFRYGRRHLVLERGEIYLAVAKDPERPFVVETPTGAIEVTGTEFNVRLATESAEVTLLEGSVALRPSAAESVLLAPGHRAVLSGRGATTEPLSPAQLQNAISWRQGTIVLDGLTLAEAAERFAVFHGRKIDVDPAVAAVRLGGTYTLDNLPQFLEALRATQSLAVLDGGGRIRIIPAR